MASLSRQLAQWVVGLRYEDLPPAVVDRAKGVTLQALASVLIGSQTRGGQAGACKLIADEEAGVRNGATLMVDGTQVTQGRRRVREFGDGVDAAASGTRFACSRIPARASFPARSGRRRKAPAHRARISSPASSRVTK